TSVLERTCRHRRRHTSTVGDGADDPIGPSRRAILVLLDGRVLLDTPCGERQSGGQAPRQELRAPLGNRTCELGGHERWGILIEVREHFSGGRELEGCDRDRAPIIGPHEIQAFHRGRPPKAWRRWPNPWGSSDYARIHGPRGPNCAGPIRQTICR